MDDCPSLMVDVDACEKAKKGVQRETLKHGYSDVRKNPTVINKKGCVCSYVRTH